MRKPIFIGITGGSGSGKTTVVNKIREAIPSKSLTIIEQDAYYKDQSHLTLDERMLTNYDHPFAFDNDLLIQHLMTLREGEPIQKPQYDYEKHTRKSQSQLVPPTDIIVLEGILIFYDKRVRDFLDIKIFVDTHSDIRLVRRITRDMKERGRTIDSVLSQYLTTVRPAHEQFVEPTKKFADIILPEGGHNLVGIDIMVAKLKAILVS